MMKSNPTSVSKLISDHIEKLAPRFTQQELAKKIGFDRPNMLSMIRHGRADIPFTRIPAIAEVLGIDPALLLRLHLRETWTEFDDVVASIMGGVLTSAERQWIDLLSEAGVGEPPVDKEERQKLIKLLQCGDWRKVTP